MIFSFLSFSSTFFFGSNNSFGLIGFLITILFLFEGSSSLLIFCFFFIVGGGELNVLTLFFNIVNSFCNLSTFNGLNEIILPFESKVNFLKSKGFSFCFVFSLFEAAFAAIFSANNFSLNSLSFFIFSSSLSLLNS